MTEKPAECEDERDWYDALLDAIGRSEAQDQRVACHELGHFLIDRITGKSGIVAVSITPRDGYEGICWGARHEAFVTGGRDASDVRRKLEPLMPLPGEDRNSTADIVQSTLDACTELMAGEAAEKLLLGNSELASDDRRQARELASLICKSPQAIERFISLCEQQALDLLAPHALAVMSLQIVLRMRRTMSAAEIDRVIATVIAEQSLAVEHRRRADWRKRELAANSFEATCDHVHDA
jgi:hypothetical protein